MGNEEVSDISLCYQAMGIPLDASPPEVERAYNSLVRDYKRKMASPDPVASENARVSLGLLEEMHGKIVTSISYCAAQREYQKKNDTSDLSNLKRPAHHAVVERSQMIHCPRCNGLVGRGLDTCPICKGSLVTPLKKLLRVFTRRR